MTRAELEIQTLHGADDTVRIRIRATDGSGTIAQAVMTHRELMQAIMGRLVIVTLERGG